MSVAGSARDGKIDLPPMLQVARRVAAQVRERSGKAAPDRYQETVSRIWLKRLVSGASWRLNWDSATPTRRIPVLIG